MTFLAVLVASVVGSTIGNLIVFSILGVMAKRVENQQKAQLEELHKTYLESVQREQERMKRYAKMEG
jgi:uncharacterized membrane-anchored protein YhcB (DUF1043 family)